MIKSQAANLLTLKGLSHKELIDKYVQKNNYRNDEKKL